MDKQRKLRLNTFGCSFRYKSFMTYVLKDEVSGKFLMDLNRPVRLTDLSNAKTFGEKWSVDYWQKNINERVRKAKLNANFVVQPCTIILG